MIYKIYGLVCPLSEKIRYIGYTYQDLEIRLKQHLRDINRKEKSHKINWLRKLNKQNLKPNIILLHDNIVCEDDACELEISYIKEHDDLTNSTNGGEKSKTFITEVKEKISNSLKEYYDTHDVWNKDTKGLQTRTEELKEYQSKLMSGDKNPMYNKSIFDIWIEKYGEIKGNKMKDEWSQNKRKYDYDYDKLYQLYIIKDMTQIEISKMIGFSKTQICRILNKNGLRQMKKELKQKL